LSCAPTARSISSPIWRASASRSAKWGSGTAADAAVFLQTAGFKEKDLTRKFLRPGAAAEELKSGDIDAFFLVGGYPIPAIANLAATIPIRLVGFEDPLLDRLKKDFAFYYRSAIPGGTYTPAMMTLQNPSAFMPCGWSTPMPIRIWSIR
jgi:TRAP transporter TAXI family solute receptor